MEARGLNFYYGSSEALKGINIAIRSRRVTALIGPSGCGKSTFLRTLNRMNDLIPHTRVEGSITLDGKDIYAPETDVVLLRQRVGIVFQRPNPFPKSILENVTSGPRCRTDCTAVPWVSHSGNNSAFAWPESWLFAPRLF